MSQNSCCYGGNHALFTGYMRIYKFYFLDAQVPKLVLYLGLLTKIKFLNVWTIK